MLFAFSISACCGGSKCNEVACENECDSTGVCNAVICSPEDRAGIEKALNFYVEAAVKGDSNVARPAFVDGATITHVENDSIVCLPIQALFDYYDQTGQHPASYEIAECNVAGDVAMVRIESKFGDAEFSDIFTLAKEGDDWKIVSKIFTVK